jgi:hypothetical protein
LRISNDCSQSEFSRIGQALSAIDTADGLWQSDFALYAQRRWKDDGLELAAAATGLSKFFLKRCARIAARFTPEVRFPKLNRNHYRVLLPFKKADIDGWLPSVADQKNLSAKSLRALAVEKFGEPVTAKQPQKHAVQIRAELFARLAQHSPTRKVVMLVEQILEDWLRSKMPAAEYAAKRRADNAERQRRWKAKHKNPAATTYHDDQQHSTAPRTPVGARPSSGNGKQSTSAHPPTPVVPETPKPSLVPRCATGNIQAELARFLAEHPDFVPLG